ncbi:MAG: hypothetical protein ACK5TA_00060, partial [bacterium]
LCHSEISDYSPPPEGFAFKLASSLLALFPVYFDERLQEVHTDLIDPYQPADICICWSLKIRHDHYI